MAGTQRRDITVIGILVVAGAIAVAMVLFLGGHHAPVSTRAASVSEGADIFQSGRDTNGVAISRSASGGMIGGGTMIGGGMMTVGCAACHGSDGHGRTTASFEAPTSLTAT